MVQLKLLHTMRKRHQLFEGNYYSFTTVGSFPERHDKSEVLAAPSKQTSKAGAGRGSRTPKGRSPADFESAASASSAIPALVS